MTPSPLYAPHPARRRSNSRPRRSPLPILLLGSAAILAFVPQEQLSRWLTPLAGSPTQQQSVTALTSVRQSNSTCQEILNKDQRLSRDQLTQFLSMAEGTTQETIHGTMATPHCRLHQSNQSKYREAYPLAFDPDTWFVINYDQGKYSDYDFVFQK
ncbi:MAG: hypothetical protein AAF821_05790 [Cyanobacteria bacterium P01_D01_bin.156]